ncbi:MAG TPA: hypothetical protein PLL02_05050, partial [Bacteroidales bacterium]|nr:hypothetical protein [Bacteroidales bacterium]
FINTLQNCIFFSDEVRKEPSFNEPIFFDFFDRKMSWYRLPSTSRAYPKSLDEKARMYKKMLEEVLMKEGR